MAMRIGKGNHWDECGFARRLDPEPVNGVPVPRLTPDIALWLSRSQVTVVEQWGPRFRAQIVKSVLGILPVLARFIVVNYVLEDGCPFVAVSRKQLQDVLCWGKGRVDNALHACALTCTRESAPEFVEACRDARACGVEPLISVVESGNGKVVTSYRLLGIESAEPTASLPASDRGGYGPVLTTPGSVATTARPEPATAGRAFVTAGPPFVPAGEGIPGPVSQPTGPGSCENSGPAAPHSGPVGAGGSMGLSKPPLVSQSSSSLQLSEPEILKSYERFLTAFGRGAGDMGDETLAAFVDRIGRGWPADVIVAGAERYRGLPVAPGGGEKWRFPLKFLRDDDHFNAVCGLPKKTRCPWSLERASMASTVDHNGARHLLVTSPRGFQVELSGVIPNWIDSTRVREWACGPGRVEVLRQCRLADRSVDWGM